jgi:spore maturation protein CgeD
MESGLMDKKVSIILTVYNKPKWLRECIESVMNQTYENWELFIMEDNSPDPEIRRIIHEFKDPRITRYFSGVSDETRYATARYATLINIAFPRTTGDYVTYLVDDDKYFPDRLQTMVDYMDANPEHQVAYHALLNIDADGNPGGVRGLKGILDGLTEETQAFNYLDHNMVMHTRQAFEDANGWYDVPGVWGGADAYFWRRLNEAGYKFYPVGTDDKPLAAKRYHETNLQALIVRGEFFPDGKTPW